MIRTIYNCTLAVLSIALVSITLYNTPVIVTLPVYVKILVCLGLIQPIGIISYTFRNAMNVENNDG